VHLRLVFMSARGPKKSWRRAWPTVGDRPRRKAKYFVASDIPALLAHTRQIFFLVDGDIAVLTENGVRVMDHDGKTVNRPPSTSPGIPSCGKGRYKHFMQKEIFEQPRACAIRCSAASRRTPAKSFSTICKSPKRNSRALQALRIVACGTSGIPAGRQVMIERLARLPVEVDYGSEYRLRDPIVDAKTLTVCISQSGETRTRSPHSANRSSKARQRWRSATLWAR